MDCSHRNQTCRAGVWTCNKCDEVIPNGEPIDWTKTPPPNFNGSGKEYFDISLGRTVESRQHRNRILKEEGWYPVDERIMKDGGEAYKRQKAVKQRRLDNIFKEATAADLVEHCKKTPRQDPDN